MPTPTRLLSRLMPVSAAAFVTQHFEDGERAPQQRIEPGLRLDHHELSRRGGLRAISGAASAMTL